MKYHFKVHKEGKRFWAKCLELDGCYTQADSMDELNDMMQEALNLYISEPESSMDIAELPDDSIKASRNIIEVPVDAEVAFSFLIRYHRIKHGMTQSQVARKMGFENVNGYQHEVEAVVACVLDGAEPVVSLADSRGNVATLEALCTSAREDRPVRLQQPTYEKE